MNDPHVVALHYEIGHAAWIDYSRAGPFDLREGAFDVHVEDGRVRFTLKTHFATVSDARSVVEDYVRSWELHALLTGGPGTFEFRFDRADVEDRSPTPGVDSVAARPIRFAITMSKPQVTVSPPNYPAPPATPLGRSPDVQSMLRRYVGYREGREPLTGMANFCLTVLESAAGSRRAASQRFGISMRVLCRVGVLCDSKGGDDARKAKGRDHPLTQHDEQFLQLVVRVMIRRAAEFAHDPNVSFELLTTSHLPGD